MSFPAKAARLCTAVISAATLMMLGVPQAIAAPPASVICDWSPSTHKVKVTIEGSGVVELSRGPSVGLDGNIYVNGEWCDGIASTANTDRITVLAGAGDQSLGIHLDNGGFRPGFTNERGQSDEVEISVSLGGGTDSVTIWGGTDPNYVRVGKSSGFGLAAINLTAHESDGIDADLTLIIGVEAVYVIGNSGVDTLSGEGGLGTGDPVEFSLFINGMGGPDFLTGGAGPDTVIGSGGGDLLKGGSGNDYINAQDGIQGNDEARGGPGNDSCLTDPGDVKISC